VVERHGFPNSLGVQSTLSAYGQVRVVSRRVLDNNRYVCCARGLIMELHWTSEGEESHSAESSLGAAGTAHLVVESLGEAGWDWHVCEVAHRLRPHYGLADTLEEAKEKAERALRAMAAQFSRAA